MKTQEKFIIGKFEISLLDNGHFWIRDVESSEGMSVEEPVLNKLLSDFWEETF